MKDTQQWSRREIQSQLYKENTLHIWCRYIFDEWKNWIKIANRRDPSHKIGMQRAGWTNMAEMGVALDKHGIVWDESRTHHWQPLAGVSWTLCCSEQKENEEGGNTGSSWMKRETQAIIFQPHRQTHGWESNRMKLWLLRGTAQINTKQFY